MTGSSSWRHRDPQRAVRLVHVATRYLGSGSERSIAAVIEALPPPEFGHTLVVGPEHDPESIRQLLGDVRVVVVRHLVRQPHPIHDPLAFAELVRVLRQTRPDVVHTIQSKSGILGRAAARSVGITRTVHTVNMANFGPGFPRAMSPFYVGLERVAARWTTQFVVNGTDLRDRYVRAGIAESDRFALIRSPFQRDLSPDVGDPLAARRALSLPTDRPIVLFAGALEKRKGVLALPEFLLALRRMVPDAYLVVAGRGSMAQHTERAMAAVGLGDSVRFVGFVPHIAQLIAAVDCLIMLSSAEGLAIVLLHAASFGTPFVSYAVDGPGELIELGARGVIVPIGDLVAAASRTADVLKAGRGPQLPLDEWAPDKVRRRYAEVFRQVLALAPGR